MIRHLRVRNFLTLQDLKLNFPSGLTVFTGDTGVGKSVVLRALTMALGARADYSVIGPEGKEAHVALHIDLSHNNQHDLDRTPSLLVRVLHADGRSRLSLDQEKVTTSTLRSIVRDAVHIQNQFEQTKLLNPAEHTTLVDTYGELREETTATEKSYRAWQEALNQHTKLEKKLQEEREYADLLQSYVKELTALAPQDGEEERLLEQKQSFQKKREIYDSLETLRDLLEREGGILQLMRRLFRSLEKIISVDKEVGKDLENGVEGIYTHAENLRTKLDTYTQEDQKEEREACELRLMELRGAALKFKTSPNQLGAKLAELQEILQERKTRETECEEVAGILKEKRELYEKDALLLSKKREVAAAQLERDLEEKLRPLKFKHMKLLLQRTESPPTASGMENYQILATLNPGFPLAPINKIASGGELSRFLLAFEATLAEKQEPSTFIFDEIDVGVGGPTASIMGKYIRQMAKKHQMICITHAPQIAIYAEQHILLEKHSDKTHSWTTARCLTGENRVEEIARMLSGPRISAEARAAATQLFHDCHQT